MRKEFVISKKVLRATAHVFGLGWYELRLNGAKVGEKALAPVNSKYNEALYYDSFDVTRIAKVGGNAAGLWLGNGYDKNYSRYGWRWMEPKRAILHLDIVYADGTRSSVVTDGSWKTAPSPITFNDIYNGETYDARLEKPSWDTYGCDDRSWTPASVVASPSPGRPPFRTSRGERCIPRSNPPARSAPRPP